MTALLTEPPLVVPAEEPARLAPPVPPERQPFLLRYRLWILLLITLIGGGIRCAWIDRPPLWGDEAFTYSRVCGTYREMLDILIYDGFPPLHYEAYWALGKATKLTPRVMRAIPATAGTLMIPAMYFLAAQIVRRRTALLVALFTCTSAYMMVYSHDAKMYMAAWLFVALNVGCLLWWLRTGLRVAWLAWIATGLAMAGLHLSSLAVLAVEPVILVTVLATQWRRAWWKRAILFLVGALVIGAGPAGYKLGFNRWGERIDEIGFAGGSGVGWVENYNRERSGPDLALFATTAHLFSWEWPPPSVQAAKPGIDVDVMHALMIVTVMLLVLMAAGAVGGSATVSRRPRSGAADVIPSAAKDLRKPASASGPPRMPRPDAAVLPAFWLSLWILVPAYGVYCTSIREFASPFDWIERLGDLFEQHWILIGTEIALLGALSHFWRRLPLYLAAAMPVAALVFLNVLIVQSWPGKQWHDAYWPILTRWWAGLCRPEVLAGVAGVLPVIAWQFSGAGFVERAVRSGRMLLVAGGVFLACWGVYRYSIYHFDQQVSKTMVDHHDAPAWEMHVQIAMHADHGLPTRDVALTQARAEFPPVSNAMLERRVDKTRAAKMARWDQLVAAKKKAEPALSDAQAQRAVAERLGSEKVVWSKWVSVWMPRYLGMCWPALAIAACALLMRLPTWPLRCGAVALLLAVNVAQSAGRLFAGSEPPLDRIYADIAAAQPKDATTRTFLMQLNSPSMGAPGSLSLGGTTGRYYLTQLAGVPIKPAEFRDYGSWPRGTQPWAPWNFTFAIDESPQAVAADVRKSPQATRVILWERLDDAAGHDSWSDRVAAQLGGGWRCVHANAFVGRIHWTWQELHTLRRTELVKSTAQ